MFGNRFSSASKVTHPDHPFSFDGAMDCGRHVNDKKDCPSGIKLMPRRTVQFVKIDYATLAA